MPSRQIIIVVSYPRYLPGLQLWWSLVDFKRSFTQHASLRMEWSLLTVIPKYLNILNELDESRNTLEESYSTRYVTFFMYAPQVDNYSGLLSNIPSEGQNYGSTLSTLLILRGSFTQQASLRMKWNLTVHTKHAKILDKFRVNHIFNRRCNLLNYSGLLSTLYLVQSLVYLVDIMGPVTE